MDIYIKEVNKADKGNVLKTDINNIIFHNIKYKINQTFITCLKAFNNLIKVSLANAHKNTIRRKKSFL